MSAKQPGKTKSAALPEYCVSVDIGGTLTKSGLCSFDNISACVVESSTEPTPKLWDAIVEHSCERIIFFAEKIPASAGNALKVSVGVPGIIRGKKVFAVNISLLDFSFHEKLLNLLQTNNFIKKRFREISVIIENDSKLFALGEAVFGAGRGKNVVLGITIGTGLGSGLIINKKIFKGRGNAPELGHTVINFDCAERAGKFILGEAEEYISKRGLLKTAASFGISCRGTKDLERLALEGNENAIKTFEAFGEQLGFVLLNAANSIDPDIIVVGGGVSKAWGLMKNSVKKMMRNSAVGHVHVVQAELEHSAILGGAAMFISSYE